MLDIASLDNLMSFFCYRENLDRDKYLKTQLDGEHYVPISTIAGFNQIKKLTSDINLVTQVLRGKFTWNWYSKFYKHVLLFVGLKNLGILKNGWLKLGLGRISGRIPDIETIRPDIRLYNFLYFTPKISAF